MPAVALGSRCTLLSFCQVPFSVQFSVGKAGSVVNLHTIHQLYVTLLFSTFREKLPRSKENFRLESDSGKRAMAVHPTPPLLQLGASTTIENCCCASCNFILVKRLLGGCRYTFTQVCCCSHFRGQRHSHLKRCNNLCRVTANRPHTQTRLSAVHT